MQRHTKDVLVVGCSDGYIIIYEYHKTMILFLVPYKCAAWPLTTREDTAGYF